MGAFGDRLRREREMRGVSLDEIAEATKIGTRLLKALEEEQFQLLPGGIFNKGFVRAYARYLGIDEDGAVADYLAAAGESGPDPKVIAEQSSVGRLERANLGEATSPRRATFPIVPVLILVVVMLGGVSGWQIYQERLRSRQEHITSVTPPAPAPQIAQSAPNQANPSGSQQASPGAVQFAGSATPSSNDTEAKPSGTAPSASGQTPPAGTPQSPSPQAPNSAEPKAEQLSTPNTSPFEVTIKAKDRAWVSVKSDGKLLIRGVMKPPEVRTIRATDQVVLWTGNAGDVEVSFNGKNVPVPGGQNDESVLVFNASGLLRHPRAQ